MEERQLHKFVAQEKCENHETKQYALDLHQSAVSKISRDNHSIRTAHYPTRKSEEGLAISSRSRLFLFTDFSQPRALSGRSFHSSGIVLVMQPSGYRLGLHAKKNKKKQ